MRLILKILCAPVIVVLTLFVWLCSGIIYCSSWVFGIAGTLMGIVAILVMISTSVTNGIILFVLAVLISPVGLPLAAVWLLAQIQKLRYAIQDRVYG